MRAMNGGGNFWGIGEFLLSLLGEPESYRKASSDWEMNWRRGSQIRCEAEELPAFCLVRCSAPEAGGGSCSGGSCSGEREAAEAGAEEAEPEAEAEAEAEAEPEAEAAEARRGRLGGWAFFVYFYFYF